MHREKCAAAKPAISYVVGKFRVKIDRRGEWTRNAKLQAPDPAAPIYRKGIDQLPAQIRGPAQSTYKLYNDMTHPQIQIQVPKLPDIPKPPPNPTMVGGRGCFGAC